MKTLKKSQQTRSSLIAAVIHVSESEIVKVIENYNADFEYERPDYFEMILWQMGLNTKQQYVRQDAVHHRNRLNEVVTCSRWYGSERSDKYWLESGYASKEAIDRSKNNSLLDDNYRARHMTTDAQDMLEARDKYRKDD
jgi:hypothetical protein